MLKVLKNKTLIISLSAGLIAGVGITTLLNPIGTTANIEKSTDLRVTELAVDTNNKIEQVETKVEEAKTIATEANTKAEEANAKVEEVKQETTKVIERVVVVEKQTPTKTAPKPVVVEDTNKVEEIKTLAISKGFTNLTSKNKPNQIMLFKSQPNNISIQLLLNKWYYCNISGLCTNLARVNRDGGQPRTPQEVINFLNTL
jgi:hypothetical protein